MLSHARIFVTLWTVAHQAPLSMGIVQARILEWVAMPSSRGSSQPRNWTGVSCIAGGFFTTWATREAPEYDSFLSMTERLKKPWLNIRSQHNWLKKKTWLQELWCIKILTLENLNPRQNPRSKQLCIFWLKNIMLQACSLLSRCRQVKWDPAQQLIFQQVCELSSQPCLTIFSPMDCSPSGSYVHGILQARSGFPFPSPGGTSQSFVFSFAGGCFTTEPLEKPQHFSIVSYLKWPR